MKGKGEKSGKSSSNLSNSDESFPTVRPIDSKLCNKILNVVNGSDHNDLQYGDIDSIYIDLELLLSAISKQAKLLNGEIQMLNSWQEKGKVGLSPAASSGNQPDCSPAPSTSQKRHSKGKLGDERPVKRMRTDSGRATYAQPVSYKGKGKNQQQSESYDTTKSSTQQQQQQIKIPKNITPLRFWAMVEPYCTDVTKEDIKFLEEQIKLCEDIDEYMRVPALGRHYTEKWKEEDELIERREVEKMNNKRKSSSSSSSQQPPSQPPPPPSSSNKNDDDGSMIKRDFETKSESSSIYGPLTQRLVQALVEENIIISNDDIISDDDDDDATNNNNDDDDDDADGDVMISDADAIEAATVPSATLARQLNVEADALEDRIKRELEALGILDPNEDDENASQSKCGEDDNGDDDDDNDDEILSEIRKKQRELKSLSQQNVAVLKNLLNLATKELEKQEIKKKISSIDAEVVECYKKLQQCKAKRKPPNRKDRDNFFKLLQDRKELLKALHAN
ncbi:hypothetical protein HELRODRAFT_191296 [Helobdella robusta]|uniref:Transcriptional adapter 3 n=1 Tax=Helobdella robusta TaxID=6412 RepID=T1FSU9_HELRO|nr:hypothetical protein HELRODRAFT_191296 [Helobdella robusta]ESO05467.1 hypothetical protein HELRODRAFT_191296 [Helobdella robusta]